MADLELEMRILGKSLLKVMSKLQYATQATVRKFSGVLFNG